ncbi:MAG: isoprenylcysteine carboxylmethyltransferase family protein, partial [Planctomycetota bacterium]|nr:isoprenylcysteine carboxylmethyltransferase family protein [Planctomycetota bacterium]
ANVTRTARTRAHHTLVTGGPYRWVRHPLYSSGVVLCTAYVLLTANWFILLMCGLAFAVLLVRTSKEEANLIKKFGDEYRAYMSRTGRFLPRLRAS